MPAPPAIPFSITPDDLGKSVAKTIYLVPTFGDDSTSQSTRLHE